MGMADAFEKEDRVPVKMSTFHATMQIIAAICGDTVKKVFRRR